jgi:ubiquitin-like protein Pup
MKQAQKQAAQRENTEEQPEAEAKDLRNEELGQDVLDLLDEIDRVLEPEAEAFVKGYIQRGGE